MHPDRAPLFRRQFLRLLHDVGNRLIDLSNVVEQGDTLDTVLRSFVEIRGARKRQRILRNTPDMRPGFSVIGVDCVEQAFQGGRPESLECNALPAFLVVESACRSSGKKG